MRILMINHEFTITGSSTAFFRLAMHLRERGHVLQLLPCNPADGPIKARYLAQAIPIIDPTGQIQCDVVIANTICAAELVLTVGRQVPTIWLINEAEVGLRILLENTKLLAAFDRAAAVIYNMPFQHDIFRSFTYHLDSSKFHTVSLGVDIVPDTIARDAVPAKKRPLRLVQVGTIERRKRPGDVILAVARSGLDMECVICGKFYQLDEAARDITVREPEKYRLLEGLTDGEILAWVDSADMFCLASGSETQSLAAYEAALLARPLLLSDLACYRDIFRHGRNCLMFPPGHIDLLAWLMKIYAGSPALRLEMGEAAQRTARRYTNAAAFSRFDAIIESVVRR